MFLFYNWENEFPCQHCYTFYFSSDPMKNPPATRFGSRSRGLRNAALEKCLPPCISGAAINKSNNEEIMHAQVGFSRRLIKSY